MKIIVLIFLMTTLLSCDNSDLSNVEDDYGLYQLANFPIGVAVDIHKLNYNEVYESIANEQYNSFTPENILKAEYLHPSENFFYWDEANLLTEYCLKNNKRIHGHTLIWHKQIPDWIKNYEGNSSEWNQLFENHIKTIVTHLKGKISGWDVVNEAFNEDGTLRNSIWKQKIGNDYIEKAFRYAHEADPDALMFYNDYNLESNPVKLNSVLHYLNSLRNRGVIIDGIGLQMHVGINFPEPSLIAESIKNVYENNYKVHLSEFDISVNWLGEDINPTQSLFRQQADYLGKILLSYKQIPTKFQYGITFWGVSDNDSWIPAYFDRKDYPLLYDNNYLPKPSYYTLKKIL